MFTGFSQATIDFMWELRFNNNRTWFLENKERFQREFQVPMNELAVQVFDGINDKCGERGFIPPRVSRIYKDARRVRDGQPYRDHLWFTLEKPSEDWTSSPVFWFELSPEKWSYGLGYYQAKALTMLKFRTRLDKHTKQFEKIAEPIIQRGEFVISGDEYARKKDVPSPKTEEWYNRKSFSLVCERANGEELFAPRLVDTIVDGCASLMGLFDYLSTIDADPDPREQA